MKHELDDAIALKPPSLGSQGEDTLSRMENMHPRASKTSNFESLDF